MGNAIEKIANCTLSFFRKVKNFICDISKRVAEVIINGVKTVVNYFKKVFVYAWNAIKIMVKLLYYKGKELIHSLTNKEGISNLIQFFNELIRKKVQVGDDNNNIIVPQIFFGNIFNNINSIDFVKVKAEIYRNQTEGEEEQTVKDFVEKDDLNSINGFHQNDSVVVTDREIKLDNISRTSTSSYSWNSNTSNYSNSTNSSYSSRGRRY